MVTNFPTQRLREAVRCQCEMKFCPVVPSSFYGLGQMRGISQGSKSLACAACFCHPSSRMPLLRQVEAHSSRFGWASSSKWFVSPLAMLRTVPKLSMLRLEEVLAVELVALDVVVG